MMYLILDAVLVFAGLMIGDILVTLASTIISWQMAATAGLMIFIAILATTGFCYMAIESGRLPGKIYLPGIAVASLVLLAFINFMYWIRVYDVLALSKVAAFFAVQVVAVAALITFWAADMYWPSIVKAIRQ